MNTNFLQSSAYELADELENIEPYAMGDELALSNSANMLRQQADRIKELEGEVSNLKHINKNWSISEGWALQRVAELEKEADRLSSHADELRKIHADRIAVLEGSMPSNFVSKLMADNVDKEALVQIQADRIAELEKELNHMRSFFGCDPAYYGMKQSEPVAWKIKWDDREWLFSDDADDIRMSNKHKWQSIPLYTTPQTKPLSDEEIDTLIENHWDVDYNSREQTFNYKGFARAIEAKVREK